VFPGPESSKRVVVRCKGCGENIPAPVEVVAEIQFMEWTGAAHLRHAKFVGVRNDKEPSKVIKET
jgi:ATP-dependent DNA ligase